LAESAKAYAANLFLYLSLLVDVALSPNYQADLLAAVTGTVLEPAAMGTVLTSALLGRSSTVVHDLIKRIAPAPVNLYRTIKVRELQAWHHPVAVWRKSDHRGGPGLRQTAEVSQGMSIVRAGLNRETIL
jgi:hypothetical protein